MFCLIQTCLDESRQLSTTHPKKVGRLRWTEEKAGTTMMRTDTSNAVRLESTNESCEALYHSLRAV